VDGVKRLNTIDLFSGCGGFSRGFLDPRLKGLFHIRIAIDLWKPTKIVYEHNLIADPETEKFLCADITQLKPVQTEKEVIVYHVVDDERKLDVFTMLETPIKKLQEQFECVPVARFEGRCDVLIGSPPCQNFSVANNTKDEEQGMELVRVYMHWVKTLQPKWWIMENVRGVQDWVKREFPNTPKIALLLATNYGVPQNRERCFAGKYILPEITHYKSKTKTRQRTLFGDESLKPYRTVKDAIGDLIPHVETMYLTDQRGYDPKANSPYFKGDQPSRTITSVGLRIVDPKSLPQNLRATNSAQDTIKRRLSGKFGQQNYEIDLNQPSRTITGMHGDSPIIRVKNQVCFDNMKDFNFEQANREIKQDKPAPTITSKYRCSGKLKVGEDDECEGIYRRLTVRECARLQSFPDDFVFPDEKMSLSAQYTLVGNAVAMIQSFALARAIARHELKEPIEMITIDDIKNVFVISRSKTKKKPSKKKKGLDAWM